MRSVDFISLYEYTFCWLEKRQKKEKKESDTYMIENIDRIYQKEEERNTIKIQTK